MLSEEKSAQLEDYSFLSQTEERLEWLLSRSLLQEQLSSEEISEELRIKECITPLWIKPFILDNRCYFKYKCDSKIILGIVSFICDLCSGLTPEELKEKAPAIYAAMKLESLLTINRRVSMESVLKKILSLA